MNRLSFNIKLVPALLLVLLYGCKTPDKGYDLYVFIPVDQNIRQFETACRDYTAKTGVRIRIGFPGSGNGINSPGDYIQALRTELNSKNKPVIFYVREYAELEIWREEGFAQDLSHTGDGAFESLVSGIAPPLRLGAEGRYGIPLAVGACGYIADRRMLAALFGSGNEDAVIAAIKTASYDEWAELVRTIDRWIAYPFPYRVLLSGRIFTFVSARSEETANLNGVFAVTKAEGRIPGEHLFNAALNAAFGNTAGITDAAGAADEETVRSAQPVFAAYARALDLENFFPAGRDERIIKGIDLPPDLGYTEALRVFSEGKAVFFGDGYGGISALNSSLAARLELLPAKVPVRAIAAPGGTGAGGIPAEKINRSIPVFAPGYHSVNALASAEEKKLGYEFLLWLSTPAQGYIADNPDFVPYYTDSALITAETGTIPHSFRDSINAYIKTGDLIAAFDLPRLTAAIGRKLDEEYMPKRFWSASNTQFWTEADYEALASFAVNEWINLK